MVLADGRLQAGPAAVDRRPERDADADARDPAVGRRCRRRRSRSRRVARPLASTAPGESVQLTLSGANVLVGRRRHARRRARQRHRRPARHPLGGGGRRGAGRVGRDHVRGVPARLPRRLQRLPAQPRFVRRDEAAPERRRHRQRGRARRVRPRRLGDAAAAGRRRHARGDRGPDPDRLDVPGVRERLSRQPDRRVGDQRDPGVRGRRRVILPDRRLAAAPPLRPAGDRTAAGTGRFKATLERAAYSAGRISAARVDSIGREDNG